MSWWQAFLLTELIEVPIYLLGMRGSDLSPATRAAVAFGASAFTHPIVWFVLLPGLGPVLGGWGAFGVAEAFALLAEWGYLAAFGVPRPLRWSLAANGTSLSIGLVLFTFVLPPR